MRQVVCIVGLLAFAASPALAAEPLPKPLVTGLKYPTGVAIGPDERIYITENGPPGERGTGRIVVVDKGKVIPFTTGLDYPGDMVGFHEWLFVVDKDRVWRIDKKGKAEVFAAAEAFPSPPSWLAGIAVDEEGTLYVSDLEPFGAGTIYRINQKGKVSVLTDGKRIPALYKPTGIAMDGMSHILVLGHDKGDLLRINIADGTSTKLADGLASSNDLRWDHFGRLYISIAKGGRVLVIPRPGDKPIEIASGFKSASALVLDPSGKFILVVDSEAGTVTALPASIPGQEVDDRPLDLEAVVAFPDLQWTGWKGQGEGGKVNPLRPLVLTHAGDGSDRVFVATEHGVIHVFPNDQKATKTKVFLDIQDRVVYDDNQNEEGFLGLTFHPNYKKNGEFFVFYTTKKAKLTNVVSRFRVRKDDPDKADPDSEEVLMEIKKPYWNHDGGTLCFGPDGYLYIAVGDGGLANDPHNNGQNLKTLLGKVLRIDVDHKGEPEGVSPRRNYAIPKDNPFVNKDGARPEIYAYGLRNVWRMAFDRKTGKLWASDVGQNLYEEIDHIVAGGNYGWNLREGLHPFGSQGVGPRKDLIDPIWEYHHDVGKSLTGGLVYRGKRLPELEGSYVYGDYVTTKIWALRYDDDKKRVTANRPLRKTTAPIMSFGEDEKGEIYFMTYSPSGKGIYWFVKTEAGKP